MGIAEAEVVDGFGSGENFKLGCEAVAGGKYVVDGDNTTCFFRDGSRMDCDVNGGNCWYTPPPRKKPPKDSLGNGGGNNGGRDKK